MSESESDKTLGDLLRVGALARQAYSPIAVAPPAPAGKELYGSSLQPNAVLDHYGFSQQLSITQLFRDLRVGRIFAIAEQIMWSEDGKAWMIDYAYVPNWVWQIDIDQ